MSSIPLFSLDSLLSPGSAKQDKVEISIGDWEIDLCDEGEVAILLTSLCAPPPIYRANPGGEPDTRTRSRESMDGHGWLFGRVTLPQSKIESGADFTINLPVRADPLRIERDGAPYIVPPPLFAGYGFFRCQRVGRRTPVRLTCRLDLSINPTRHLFHSLGRGRRTRYPSSKANDCWQRFPPSNGEFSLDGNDNWLPQHRWLLKAAEEEWSIHFRRYLADIERAFEIGPWQWRRVRREYNVRKVESYFEMRSENPFADIEALQSHIGSFSCAGGSVRTYQSSDASIGQAQSILRVNGRKAETLKIYAKTNQRLRFEVVHNFQGQDRFQFPRSRVQQSSAHMFESIDDVLAFLNALASRSATLTNDFLAHVASQTTIPRYRRTVYSALLHIRYCLPRDLETADFIVSMLVHHQGISIPKNASSEFRDGVKALLREEIIKRGANRGSYVISSSYRAPLALLRENRGFIDLQPPSEQAHFDV